MQLQLGTIIDTIITRKRERKRKRVRDRENRERDREKRVRERVGETKADIVGSRRGSSSNLWSLRIIDPRH